MSAFLTEADRRQLAEAGRWVADEGPRDLWLLVDTIVAQHVANESFRPDGGAS